VIVRPRSSSIVGGVKLRPFPNFFLAERTVDWGWAELKKTFSTRLSSPVATSKPGFSVAYQHDDRTQTN